MAEVSKTPPKSILSALLDERFALAATLAEWRRRWDAAITVERGSAEYSMAGLKSLDDHALVLLARQDQASPSDFGGTAQPPLPSAGRDCQ